MRAATTAAVVGATTYATLRRRPPGGAQLWQRTNYRGAYPSLLAGPAVTVAASIGSLPVSLPAAGLTLACGGLGLYDDLAGDSHARGLRGHLVALRQRRITTGMVKLVGLVVAGVATSILERRRAADVVIDTLLVAGTANLINLFDLRPGRALKVVAVAGLPLAGRGAAPAVGAALAMLPTDLAEDAMIGDCGANALGALLGFTLSHGLGRRARFVALAGVVGLTLASERVSFTDVIAGNRWLSAIDALGRKR
jgi:hypothetical protein